LAPGHSFGKLPKVAQVANFRPIWSHCLVFPQHLKKNLKLNFDEDIQTLKMAVKVAYTLPDAKIAISSFQNFL
jgi:hypothetical protein